MNYEVTDRHLGNGAQSWNLTEVRRYHDGPVVRRATVRRNSYDDQSYALVEQWSDVGWVEIVRWAITETPAGATRDNGRGVQVPVVSYVQKYLTPDGNAAMTATADALFDTAARTLDNA